MEIAVVLGLDMRLLEGLAGRSTDVEGTHGELRAGFADGLRGNDADRLAELDQLAGGQVASIAHSRKRRGAHSQVSTERIFDPLDADLLQIAADRFRR